MRSKSAKDLDLRPGRISLDAQAFFAGVNCARQNDDWPHRFAANFDL